MALTNINNLFVDHQKILVSFASAQLDDANLDDIRHNQFYLFAVTSFLHGATHQLGKQSSLPDNLQQKYMHNLLCDLFSLPRHNAEGLLSSTERMMGNYYLLDNIYQEGQNAAEKWLNSDATPCNELKDLMVNYQDFTMLDMKAAGMKSSVPDFPADEESMPERRSGFWFKMTAWTVIIAMLAASLVYFYKAGIHF